MYGKELFVLKSIRLLAARLAHTNLVYGQRAKNLFEMEGINNVEVVFNSIGNSRTDEITSFKGVMTIVYIGRILKDRKLDMLLELVEYSNLNLRVKIFGNGEYRETLIENIEARNLMDKVDINHAVYGMDVVRVLESAHLTVSPGRVGLLAVESVSNMTPIITHDDFTNQMPEIEIIEEGVTGSFFKRDDISSLHNKVEFWYRIYEQGRLDSRIFNKKRDIYNVQNQLNIFSRNLC
jgi:glycosyltransferase involved in cell wall biosynthesis